MCLCNILLVSVCFKTTKFENTVSYCITMTSSHALGNIRKFNSSITNHLQSTSDIRDSDIRDFRL